MQLRGHLGKISKISASRRLDIFVFDILKSQGEFKNHVSAIDYCIKGVGL